MTAQERVASIMRFGYAERQARFLELVAMHGGYFMCRHFTAYIERRPGPISTNFLRAVSNRNHAHSSRVARHTHIYHLTSRTLYRVMGEKYDYHRPMHEVGTIRRRLIGLDFILSRRHWTFLAAEPDLLAFFVDERHMPHDVLPRGRRRSPSKGTASTRYFQQRDPVAISPDRSAIAFAFRDDGDATHEGFTHFLRRYAPLCQRLSMTVEIVYVTAADGQLDLAKHTFANAFRAGASQQTAGERPPEGAVLAYVRARHRVETGNLQGLRQQELDALRIDLHRFTGVVGDDWYRCWQTGGDLAIRETLNARPVLELQLPCPTRLLVHRVPFDYRPLGLWRGGRC